MDGFINDLGLFLQTAIQMGTPLLFATLGGLLSEKVGHMNLGIEGMMLMGAVFGVQAALATASPLLAFLAAGVAGAGGALIYAIVTVTLRGNQVVTGLSLTIFGTGVSGFIGQSVSGVALPEAIVSAFTPKKIPVLSDIPLLGDALFSQSLYVYLALIAAILIYVYLYKTKRGLSTRAVGENPAAADASGVHVSLYKYVNITLGGFLCGIGGSFLSLAFIQRWQDGITAGQGWIAVALIIFATWNPLRAIFGAYFFGALRGIAFKLQSVSFGLFGVSVSLPAQFLEMIPYVVTILALVFISMRRKRESQPPQSLGIPYFREDR